MAPRTLFAMIDQWREIEEYGKQVQAFLNRGGTLPGKDADDGEYIDVHPDAF